MGLKLAKNLSIWLILVLCACACASSAASRAYDIPSATKKFEEWMSRHERDYKDVAEKAKRLKIFSENLRFVEEFNGAANRTYKVGLNKFSDLTNEEFVAAYTGYKLPSSTRRKSSPVNSFKYQGLNSIPESVDWVKQDAVNPIKNQGQCGSCWSFSVVAAVEAITQITTGVLPNLSEQQLIDCATDGNHGCKAAGWTMALSISSTTTASAPSRITRTSGSTALVTGRPHLLPRPKYRTTGTSPQTRTTC
ncbi:hypothetical protein EUGRSUZ_E02741 [Eucalyptus grandis]|uniref:Cathepsin propeptide inhibitor domain-containing protein n=2 Tax=Eucalyptus grandis TaxID=71139 RepID=A0A059C781_EUCGR|nr:hypothetical protein EUGRSUZ_E02741 [Eucalyptus grandis]